MPDGIRWVGLDVQSAGINRHGEVVNANAGGRTDWWMVVLLIAVL